MTLDGKLNSDKESIVMPKSHQWMENSDVLPIFPTLIWKVQLTSGALESVNGRILKALTILRPSGADSVSS